MSDVYLIEVEGRAVGLVARESDGTNYRFHAAEPGVFCIDGQIFKTADEAQRAARAAMKDRSRHHLDHTAPRAA